MAKDIKESTAQAVAVGESVYEAAEIAANAQRLFGCSVDMAAAALEYNKVPQCTLSRAEKIIKAFAERKVD